MYVKISGVLRSVRDSQTRLYNPEKIGSQGGILLNSGDGSGLEWGTFLSVRGIFTIWDYVLIVVKWQAWQRSLFPCKLCKISLQQGRFPSSVGGFPLCISLFFPSKSQNFHASARSFPFCLFQGFKEFISISLHKISLHTMLTAKTNKRYWGDDKRPKNKVNHNY